MAKQIKVLTIVGTRPEIIKLSRVIPELDKYTQHVLVHTGQNYDFELNKVFFDELELRKPDYFLEIATGNVAQDYANVIAKIDPVLEKEKPDAVLIYGDTNSALSAIPAKRRHIPIFHMEAGNRCFDSRVSEEINRKIVDHLSDINMTLTEHARRYLVAEGIKSETIFKTGSCLKEVYSYYQAKIDSSKVLSQLELKKDDYFVVSLHREDNVDSKENLAHLMEAFESTIKTYNKTIVVSTHPRTRKRLDEFGLSEKLNDKILFLKPFGLFDYVKLQSDAFCVLSDSGSITEESSILNFPGVMLRRMHERPEGMDEASVIMTGINKDRILQAIEIATSQHESDVRNIKMISDYDVDNVSKKVVRIILSYIDYIKQNTWREF